MQTEIVEYTDGQTEMHAFMAYEKSNEAKPGILIFHDWSGCNDMAKDKAKELAKKGYVAFAVDMFGLGQVGQTNEEKSALMMPLMNERALLKKRALAALDKLQSFPFVLTNKIAAIGFCFGGLCALDLARSGASSVLGVASFHGLLLPCSYQNKITAKILVLHGYDDPMVPPDHLISFAQEMKKAEADWQMHIFGNTMHAFTNPKANDKNFGTVYSASADKRAFEQLDLFLEEIF